MYIERVPNRSSPPAVLLRESYRLDGKGQETHPRQPLQVARRTRRGTQNTAQGGRRAALPRRRLRDPPRPAARACRRRPRHAEKGRPRKTARPQALAPEKPRRRHDRGAHPRTPLQARHRQRTRQRNRQPHPRRGTRRRGCLGRRPLRRHGLAAGTPDQDRTRTRQAASRRRLARPLRPDLGLPRRPQVQAGQARLLQGQEAGKAPDRPRPALQTGTGAR